MLLQMCRSRHPLVCSSDASKPSKAKRHAVVWFASLSWQMRRGGIFTSGAAPTASVCRYAAQMQQSVLFSIVQRHSATAPLLASGVLWYAHCVSPALNGTELPLLPRLRPMQANMGAKNHAVVMPDANVEATTSALVGRNSRPDREACPSHRTVVASKVSLLACPATH